MSETIQLVLVTPKETVFEGKVAHISIPAADGYMGFLPRHAPLVSPLGIGVLTADNPDGTKTVFTVAEGYFEIDRDRMIVLADVSEVPEEIDVKRAEKAKERAEKRLSGEWEGNWNMERARASLQRSIARLSAAKLR